MWGLFFMFYIFYIQKKIEGSLIMHRGRPRKDSQFCSMKLEKDVYEILKRIAKEDKTTMTKIVEKSVRDYNLRRQNNASKN